MTHAFQASRRAALRTGLGLAAALAFPALASADDRFFVEVVQPQATPVNGDVLEMAAAAGQFTTFLRALRVAGYEETLRGSGPFTVFAPTDEAFTRMRRTELDRLMQPRAHEELLSLVTYHVAQGRLTTGNLHGRVTRARSANGNNLEIDATDGLRVNDQLVVLPDIDARNGVVQGINTILSPPVLVASAGALR